MQLHSIIFAAVCTVAFATPRWMHGSSSRNSRFRNNNDNNRSPSGSFRSSRGSFRDYSPYNWGSNRNDDYRQWDRRSYNYNRNNNNNNDGGRYWDGYSSWDYPRYDMSRYPSFSRNSGMGNVFDDGMFGYSDYNRNRNSGFGMGGYPDYTSGFNSGYPMGSSRISGSGFNSGYPMGSSRISGSGFNSGYPMSSSRISGSGFNSGYPMGSSRISGSGFNTGFQMGRNRDSGRGINSGYEMGGYRDYGLGLNSGFDMGGQRDYGMRNSGFGFDRYDLGSSSFNYQPSDGYPQYPGIAGGSGVGGAFRAGVRTPRGQAAVGGGVLGYEVPGSYPSGMGYSYTIVGGSRGSRQRRQSSRSLL